MTEPSINPSSTNHLPRCQHRTRTGRRCRHPVCNVSSGFCSKHLHSRTASFEEFDLSSVLIGDIEEFRDAVTINHSLGELYKLLARNKITPRRGAVMAYTANLLLRTLPAIEHESGEEEQEIIFDMPRPRRDDPVTSDTLALIRNISNANCTPEEHAPEKKLS
jgi:hypothetical protein